jgi:hypothetical protein
MYLPLRVSDLSLVVLLGLLLWGPPGKCLTVFFCTTVFAAACILSHPAECKEVWALVGSRVVVMVAQPQAAAAHFPARQAVAPQKAQALLPPAQPGQHEA